MMKRKSIFDMEAMMVPVKDALQKWHTEEKSQAISTELEKRVIRYLKNKEYINRTSQERRFYIDLDEDLRFYGDVQFLLVQVGKYNVFQAIGWKMNLKIYGEELKYNKWKDSDHSPKVLVYWDDKSQKVDVTLNESATTATN